MNNPKWKLSEQFHSQQHQSEPKLNPGGERLAHENYKMLKEIKDTNK